MVDSTLKSPIIATEVMAPEKYSLTRCRICSEFGSEKCDVLVDLARYRRTEAILKAAERHAAGFNVAKSIAASLSARCPSPKSHRRQTR